MSTQSAADRETQTCPVRRGSSVSPQLKFQPAQIVIRSGDTLLLSLFSLFFIPEQDMPCIEDTLIINSSLSFKNIGI